MNGREQLLAAASRAVPNTLDLTDRAKLAQNYLIGNPEPKRGYRPYFGGTLSTDPPSYGHSAWDFGDVTGRFVEAFILNRIMVGGTEGEEVERGVREFMMSLFRKDGLSYRGPVKDWDPAKEGEMFFWDQGRVLYGLVALVLHEGDARAEERIRGMIKGLKQVAVHSGRSAWFPYESMYRGRYVERRDLSQTLWAASGQPIEPLVRYFEATGNEEALDLAGRLSQGLLDAPVHFFERDGSFTLHELPYHYAFHVHSHTAALIGLLRYGIVTGDKELVNIGRMAYEWIRKRSSTSCGWTCEHYPFKTLHDDSQEVCCLTDILTLAVLLAEAGYEQYWNDVERIARNHLVESQITSLEAFEPFLVGLKHLIRKIDPVEKEWRSYERIAERMLGGTSGEGWVNEMYRPPGIGVSGCCSPHMVKGFYLAWSHIATRAKGVARVNLALSFTCPWIEVRSHHPHEGKLEIGVAENTAVAVRVADWVDRAALRVSIDGRKPSFAWKGDYVLLQNLAPGEVLEVRYPLRQAWIREEVGTASFDFRWRGDTIVEVKPKGMVVPTYQRGFMDADKAPARSDPVRKAPEDFHLW